MSEGILEPQVRQFYFVAVITEKFLAQTKAYLKICDCAMLVSTKPMYAIVQLGLNWTAFCRYPWRMVFLFDGSEAQYDLAWNKIKEDVKEWKKGNPPSMS